MRTPGVAAALVLGLTWPSFAYDLQTKNGQVICDTLPAFEELTIAIGMNDDEFIAAMGGKGCHLPSAGLRMELIEAYPDQTALLFSKLAEYTHLKSIPDHIERLTSLAKVRLFDDAAEPMVGFTMLPVSQRPAGRSDQE